MQSIKIEKTNITDLSTGAIVNAANTGLLQGGGVCGAIFKAAGAAELTEACQELGSCGTGGAVMTEGFKLKSPFIIHAVGPIYVDGKHSEAKLLYSAYRCSLNLARGACLESIGFPLISAGIYGYPVDEAWSVAIKACRDFFEDNPDYELQIIFAVLDERILEKGQRILDEMDYKW